MRSEYVTHVAYSARAQLSVACGLNFVAWPHPVSQPLIWEVYLINNLTVHVQHQALPFFHKTWEVLTGQFCLEAPPHCVRQDGEWSVIIPLQIDMEDHGINNFNILVMGWARLQHAILLDPRLGQLHCDVQRISAHLL